MNFIFHELLGIIMEVYIDNIVVKSVEFEGHLAYLRLAFERMRKSGLKMNPLKCPFAISVGRFLGFIVHEKGIEVDPKKIESIKKIQEPSCRNGVQSLLSKVNYLRQFISNLAGRVKSLLLLVHLKHERAFTWGVAHKEVFDRIKDYLVKPPVLQAPVSGHAFRLYIATQYCIVWAVLPQEDADKEFVIAYASWRLLDAETRYAYIEKFCLSLYYACSKFQH
jgi:hypothetical protein